MQAPGETSCGGILGRAGGNSLNIYFSLIIVRKVLEIRNTVKQQALHYSIYDVDTVTYRLLDKVYP